MSELISIREAGRRLGVSDTAVRKAITGGRVSVHSKDPANGRPLLDWEATQSRWLANSDVTKRSHVGSRGSDRRAKDAPRVKLTTSDRLDEADTDHDVPTGEGPKSGRGGGYAQARAAREVYEAKLSKLKFEQQSGKLIDADQVRVDAYKLASAVISGLYNIPDRISDQLAGMTDANAIQNLLLSEIDNAIEELRKAYAPAANH